MKPTYPPLSKLYAEFRAVCDSLLKSMIPRTLWGYIAWILILAGGVAGILRFALGLGATTNLTDNFPWGMWIAFDFFGIGLAASGFTMVCFVYLFNVKKWEPIVRPAIVIAYIGYTLVVAVLILDLGRPLSFWHVLLPWMWNWHSVMFEITWCVIIYTTVLLVEFLPVWLERYNINAPIDFIHRHTLPLMIGGVIFSTLHQSSFGSLYLIVPNRMHDLWYTPMLPVLFYISCISMGLSMVLLLSLVIERKGKKILTDEMKDQLAKIAGVVIGIYLVVRFQDMYSRGVLGSMATIDYHSLAFFVEILPGFILPLALLLVPKIRQSRYGLYFTIVLIFLGFAANRMNTVVTSLEKYGVPEWMYFPSTIEILTSAGIAAFGISTFILFSRHLPMFKFVHEEKTD